MAIAMMIANIEAAKAVKAASPGGQFSAVWPENHIRSRLWRANRRRQWASSWNPAKISSGAIARTKGVSRAELETCLRALSIGIPPADAEKVAPLSRVQ
jgi:hypothetical protein